MSAKGYTFSVRPTPLPQLSITSFVLLTDLSSCLNAHFHPSGFSSSSLLTLGRPTPGSSNSTLSKAPPFLPLHLILVSVKTQLGPTSPEPSSNSTSMEHFTTVRPYKLLYAGRHGQGFHNVGESKYGTPAWDSYWSELNGDGNITWGPDARLTELGVEQAQAVHDGWMSMLKQSDSAPLPSRLFSSPLSRALSTMEICMIKFCSTTRATLPPSLLLKTRDLMVCSRTF